MAPRNPKTDATKTGGKTADQVNDDVLPEAEDDIDTTAGAEGAAPKAAAEGAAPGDEPAARPEPMRDDDRDAIVRRYREMRNQENAPADQAGATAGGDEGAGDEAGASEGDSLAGGEKPAEMSSKSEPGEGGDDNGDGAAEPSQPTEIELIIDGKKVKKPLDEVVALAQINGAADKRLEEAKRILQDAQAKAEALARRDPEHPRDPQTAAEPTQTRDDGEPEHQPAEGIDPDKLREIAERIQVGDTDEGVQALNELVTLVNGGRPRDHQVSAEQVGTIVQQHLLHRETQAEIDKALESFGKEFPELASDQDLRTTGLDLVAREMRDDLKSIGLTDADLVPFGNSARALAQAHRTARASGHKVRSYGEVLSHVGEYMTKKFNLRQSNPPSGDPSHQNKQQRGSDADTAARRAERKREAPQQPRTAGARVPAPQQPKPKTRAEVVEEMRRSRGFARMA